MEGEAIAEKTLSDLNNKKNPQSFNDTSGKNLNIEETFTVQKLPLEKDSQDLTIEGNEIEIISKTSDGAEEKH